LTDTFASLWEDEIDVADAAEGDKVRSTDARCAFAAGPTPALAPSAGDRGGKSSKLTGRPWNGGVESTREDEEDEEDAGAAGSLREADADGAEYDKVELLELELAADAIPNGGESEAPRGKSGGEELDADAHASGMSPSDSRGELASSRTVEGK
jgi:hypothetical protein